MTRHSEEEKKRELREQTMSYVYRAPTDPTLSEFHYHFCRVCQEEHECTTDDCELALQTICHNCYYKLEEGES